MLESNKKIKILHNFRFNNAYIYNRNRKDLY